MSFSLQLYNSINKLYLFALIHCLPVILQVREVWYHLVRVKETNWGGAGWEDGDHLKGCEAQNCSIWGCQNRQTTSQSFPLAHLHNRGSRWKLPILVVACRWVNKELWIYSDLSICRTYWMMIRTNLIYNHDMIQHSKQSTLRTFLWKLTVFMMIENTRQHLNV